MNILYFTADWCQRCKKTRPIVEEMNRENYSIKFSIVDVDIEKDLAIKFNIRSVPTFVLLNNGVELRRIVGGQTKQQLEKFIQDI